MAHWLFLNVVYKSIFWNQYNFAYCNSQLHAVTKHMVHSEDSILDTTL